MKRCNDCKVEKPFSDFNRKGAGYQSRCRECQKVWYKQYYSTSTKEKERLAQQRRDNYKRFRAFLQEAKNKPCMDCGISYPFYVMDFDHRDGKEKEFNIGLMSRKSLAQVEQEIAKCDVVCANCHRQRTYSRLTVHDADDKLE